MKVDRHTITYVYKIMGYTHVVFGKRQEQKLHQKLTVTLNAELPLFSLVWDKPQAGVTNPRGVPH